jgi:protein AbiQ
LDRLKLYSVSDAYIEYLQKVFPNVYSNKTDTRVHTRKYIGVVINVDEYKYYIPLSSPKETDYQIAGNENVIKKSIVPIIRIVVKNSEGKKELKGTLRISHMVPVPETELELYDLEHEPDETYKDLIHQEIVFIRKNREKIIANASLLYKQKTENDIAVGYVKSALDYKALERLCVEYTKEKI